MEQVNTTPPPMQQKSKEEILKKYIEIPFRHTRIVSEENALAAMEEYRSQPTSEEYKLETGDGYGTTYGASQPPASGGYSPEQYWVKFTEMGDDYPNEKVVEMVSMPSGDIVVRVESGESLWFDKDGNHPKSKLIKIPKQNN